MTVDELMDEVSRRVNERLPSAIFSALVEQHKRRAFRLGCQCDYCSTKRFISHMRGYGEREEWSCVPFKGKNLSSWARHKLQEVAESEEF